MKKFKYIYVGLVSAILCGTLPSCDNYLDINDNPNYSPDASVSTLFPSAQAGSVAALGYLYELYGGMWSQHYTQANSSSQYNAIVNYSVTSNDDNRMWSIPYSTALPDLDLTIKKAAEEGAWNYWVMAKVMMAFDFHVLADTYGSIPFTEALQGDSNPKYDDSKTEIYPGLIAMLDEAIAKGPDAMSNTMPVVSNEDFVFAGDVEKWISFAKSLKLKLLMRDFETNKAAITALLNENDLLLDVDATVHSFEDAVNKSNPFYENDRRQLNTKSNVRACTTLCNYLLANKDPRIGDFYETTTDSETGAAPAYAGIRFGDRPSTGTVPISATSRAKIEALDPVYFMSAAEVAYLKAEAYAKLGDKVKAKAAYDNAVTLSFARWNREDEVAAFIEDGGAYEFNDASLETMLTSILTQKWVASTRCQAWDAWFDINRTGIPVVGTLATNAPGYVLGTLTPSVNSSLPDNGYPHRLVYPRTSTDYNTSAPEVVPMTTVQWWQKQ